MTDTLDPAVVTALTAGMGEPLTIGPKLPGSSRNVVFRATAGDRAVVVKHAVEDDGGTRYRSERAALAFYAGDPELARLVPGLVYADDDTRTIVTDDIGECPTLAELLLAQDSAPAHNGLRELSALLGTFARRCATRLDAFDATGTFPNHFALMQVRERVGGLTASPAAEAALLDACAALESPGAWGTVGSADACPDNVLVTPAGLKLIDFEGGAVYHALFDTATLTLPFPSCWCHDALPDPLRSELLGIYAEAAGRPVDVEALARVTVVWSAWALTRWLKPMRKEEFVHLPELVTGRQRVRAAVQAIAGHADGALHDWAAALDDELHREWGASTDARPQYPALLGMAE